MLKPRLKIIEIFSIQSYNKGGGYRKGQPTWHRCLHERCQGGGGSAELRKGGIDHAMTLQLCLMIIVVISLFVICVRRPRFYPDEAFKAFTRGDLEEAGAELSRDPGLLKGRSKNGWTALHFAAWRNQSEMVKFLLSRGADPRAKDNDHRRPRHYTESQLVAGMLGAQEGGSPAKRDRAPARLRAPLKFKEKGSASVPNKRSAAR